MKRFLLLALLLSVSTFGLVGCSEKSTETVTATKDTPNGKIEEKQTTEIKKTGNERDGH